MRSSRLAWHCDGRVAIGFVSAALLAAAAAAGEAPIELRLAPAAGKILRYQIDNQTDINHQGLEITTMATGRLNLTRAADAKNGNLIFDVVIEKLDASQRQGDKLETQNLGLDGAKAQAEVTPRGTLVKVDAVSSMDEQQHRLAENLVDAVFMELPEKPAKVGDTWKADMGKPDGSRKGSGVFTLDEVVTKGGHAVAKMSGPVTTESTAPPLSGKGTYEGNVAVEGGYIVRAKGTMDLEGADGTSVQQTFELKLVE